MLVDDDHMGRPRGFDERTVIAAATRAFTDLGYEATSVDDLLQATGLHRGSLYQAFGSKRGLFLAVLRAHLSPTADRADETLLDLLLVAILELAPRDDEVRTLAARALAERALAEPAGPEDAASLLGRRLLARAHIDPAPPSRRDPAS